jgi:hypothetical protein
MSIPNRIWRILRGRWLMANDDVRDALAAEMAEYELAEPTLPPVTAKSGLPPAGRHSSGGVPSRTSHAGRTADPLAADLALLGAPPACDMPTLDRIYQERLAELDRDPPAADPGGERRAALSGAYERLRDAINTTETRFERLEF